MRPKDVLGNTPAPFSQCFECLYAWLCHPCGLRGRTGAEEHTGIWKEWNNRTSKIMTTECSTHFPYNGSLHVSFTYYGVDGLMVRYELWVLLSSWEVEIALGIPKLDCDHDTCGQEALHLSPPPPVQPWYYIWIRDSLVHVFNLEVTCIHYSVHIRKKNSLASGNGGKAQ